ncbi:ChbG/HpnK family deacetylase [Rhizobacter fulvus]
MLIVNADDLGRRPQDTDSALACHARGRIDSASAMVHMADSERAAGLARAADLRVGLHLNLSEPFTADVHPQLRASHARVCRFLRSSKYALLLYRPFLADDFARVVDAQFAEFQRLYGREPAHVDGHQHMHLCTNVLWQRLLPEGVRVRRSFSFAPGQKSALNRLYRALIDQTLARRHLLVDQFFSLSQQLSAARLDAVAALARDRDVELMAHPAWRLEYDYLMSDAFAALLQTLWAPSPRRPQP